MSEKADDLLRQLQALSPDEREKILHFLETVKRLEENNSDPTETADFRKMVPPKPKPQQH